MIRELALAALMATLAPLALASISAEAAPVLVTSRAALDGTDHLNWADLGPSGTLMPNAFSMTSHHGFSVDVSKASAGNFQRREQDFSWSGNFAPGAQLLYTNHTPGPISFEFEGPVFGGGAQIQWDFLGNFTATIEAFDTAGLSLGSFTLDGNSSWLPDGTPDGHPRSAIFIGILDSAQSVARIEIGLTTDESFTINQFDIAGTPHRPTQVHEPGTLALLGAGLVSVGLLRRRKTA